MRFLIVICMCFITLCNTEQVKVNHVFNSSLHRGLTERIGNFSIELLYHTTQAQRMSTNLIISPITVWTVLAVIAEGATDETQKQIYERLRVPPKLKDIIRKDYQEIAKYLQVNTSTVEVEKLNALFINEKKPPLRDFIDASKQYDTHLIAANFSDPQLTANSINNLITTVTHGRIQQLVDITDIINSNLIITSALYFKGQWALPFNASYTTKEPFYDSMGNEIGKVKMMYRRDKYPFANIKSLQARLIELPYGNDKRLSMLIMVPYPMVSLTDMFYNFGNVSLDTVFDQLKISQEEYSEDEVDCYIPRFKIESTLELKDSLSRMGIRDLFSERKARLPLLSNYPIHVAKIIHKAEIEVTEEGTVAAAVTAAEFSNRIAAIKFEANKPFCYLIIEKITNSIVFGGFYHTPSLF